MNLTMPNVFGVLLEKIPTRNKVPFIVDDLITHLTSKQSLIEVEGIFRISGNQANITKIRNDYDMNVPVDLTKYDVHTVAGVLRSFFRDLPDSLVKKENVSSHYVIS